VASSIEIDLNILPKGAEVNITSSLEPGEEAGTAFELAATTAGMGNTEVAYSINVVKTNLENGSDIKSAAITMKAGIEWVEKHGGTDAVKIVRYDAETGEKEVLETAYLGQDEQGRAIFRGLSPHGLSVFGLLGRIIEPAMTVANPPSTTSEQIEEVMEKSSPNTIPVPASFIVRNLTVNPERPSCDQTVVITCNVANAGEVEDTYTTGLKINGTVLASQPITIAGGKSAVVTFSRNLEAGRYEIEIGDQKTTLEVAPLPSQDVSGTGFCGFI